VIYLSEDDLRQPVHEFLEKKGFMVLDERRLFSRKIDVIGRRRSEVVTVELKLNNWKDAIEQARLNQRVSDYSYIALQDPLGRFGSGLFIEAIQNGIGVLSVNGVASETLRPRRSPAIQKLLRRSFLASLRSE
jgi:hypothetical protein